MSTQRQAPVVAIVGRPNVGKSAVFNRLAGRRISIVHNQAGVTRDRILAPAGSVKTPLMIMDTGGIGESLDDGFGAQVEVEAEIAMEEADVILFVVDGKMGRTPVDEFLAERLRRKNVEVVLAVNKTDGPEHEGAIGEFTPLGFEQTMTISATTGRGFDVLRRWLEERFPAGFDPDAEQRERPLRLAIIGRPNVGKSSLVNAVLDQKRTIVSETAGTTRDSIEIPFTQNQRDYILVDTAGMRRRTKIDDTVESFSFQKARDAVKRADVVMLVVDAAAGATMQERKIAQFMLDEHKPCVLVYNKYDLYHPDAPQKARLEELTETAREEFFFMTYAPVIAVSAKQGQFVSKIFHTIEEVRTAALNRPGTGHLNRVIHEAIERTPPPAIKGKRLKLLYATFEKPEETALLSAPNVVCFVNYTHLITETYLRYLENQIRTAYPMEGLPIRFDMRERRRNDIPALREKRTPAAARAKSQAARAESKKPSSGPPKKAAKKAAAAPNNARKPASKNAKKAPAKKAARSSQPRR
jgi:GTPase